MSFFIEINKEQDSFGDILHICEYKKSDTSRPELLLSLPEDKPAETDDNMH